MGRSRRDNRHQYSARRRGYRGAGARERVVIRLPLDRAVGGERRPGSLGVRVTSLARLALLLAALACWRGGSRPVAAALVAAVVASAYSTLPIPRRLAYALYLVPAAASAWLAMRVASGHGWPAVVAWFALAFWAWLAPRGSPWAAVRFAWGYASLVVQVAAVAVIGTPRASTAWCVVVLCAGDVAAALAPLVVGPAWWPSQAQAALVAAALIWIHRDVFRWTVS